MSAADSLSQAAGRPSSAAQSIATSSLPGGRKSSVANRAVAAIQEAFPVPMNPSPLVTNTVRPVVAPVTRIPSGRTPPSPAGDPAEIVSLRKEYTANIPVPPPVNWIKKVPENVLVEIFTFLGSFLKAQQPLALTCAAWYRATFSLTSRITLYPGMASVDALSRVGSMSSLANALRVSTRGQHIVSLTIMQSNAVYGLPKDVEGPLISATALASLVLNLPYLEFLDVRGIKIRDWAPWRDHFLADLGASCPRLKSVRVGPQFLRNWEPQWWANLPALSEFVVGSRREDVDWHDPTNPLQLHEDFYAMLRSPSHRWENIKIWTVLAPQSFTQLLLPTAPFSSVKHLAVNATGNLTVKPLEDSPTEGGQEKKKADAKSKKADDGANSKIVFPVLQAFTVADVKDRPEFASELMVKITAGAPNLKHFNVVNTHRDAPFKVVAPPPKPAKRGAASPTK